MDRVKPGYAAAIEAAYSIIPAPMHDLIRPHFLTGTDPVFAGLHGFTEGSFGRSYSDTAHVAYDVHQSGLTRSQRRVTVVLPHPEPVEVLVHELGHVLHETLLFEPSPTPVSWYAQTNTHEAFAEAFTSWLVPGYAHRPDDATVALLEELCDGH